MKVSKLRTAFYYESCQFAKGGLLLRLSLWLILAAVTAFAQGDRGTITGTLSDPAGAVVPGVRINLINTATGAPFETVTTGTGNYTLPSLPVGRYNLTVAAPGFSQYVREGIDVQGSQTSRIDILLQVGANTETVTVTANAPLLKTEGAEQSQTLGGDEINRLPLTIGGNGLYGTRSPLAGLDLVPGAANTVGTNFVFRANGSTNQARYLLDGQDISLLGMASSHLSESHPSTEAVQEVTLLTSNFAAEYGQVQGGLVSFTSRSGTNQFHGGGYDYLQNEFLNAGRPFTDNGNGHLIRPRQRNNNYGFTVGGPVWLPKLYNGRNKTFFFFTIDQFRQTAIVSGAALTVPTAAYRTGDFSGALTGRTLGTDPLGNSIRENAIYDPLTNQTAPSGQLVRTVFPGNIIPQSRLSSVAQKIQALIPVPTNGNLTNNLALVDSTSTTTTLPSFKIDHNVGAATKLSFYFGTWRNFTSKSAGDGLPHPISNAREFITHTPSFRLSVDHTFTPTFLVHLGVGEIRYWHVDASPELTRNFDAVGKLGLTGGLLSPAGFPSVAGLGSNQGGINATLGWNNNTLPRTDDHPTIVLNGTLVKGNHTYKAGAEWWRDFDSSRSGATGGSYVFSAAETGLPYLQTTSVGGGTIGFPYASFLLGDADSASIRNQSQVMRRKWAYGAFLQDTWKVTRKITLDYGLRYDLQTGSHELNDRSASFAPNLPNPSAGGLRGATIYEGYGPKKCNCSFTQPYKFGFGPRLGLAFQIDSKTVLRAGWGLVYGRTPSTSIGSSVGGGFNTLNFTTTNYGQAAVNFQNGLRYDVNKLYEATYDPGIFPQPGTITSAPNWYDDTGGRPPRINQWNISLQRQVLPDLMVEAAYVGNRSSHILSNNVLQLNASSPQMLQQKGFDITNAADRAILTSPWNSPAAAARGIKAPYPGYPTGLTVAQVLRPYPQFGSIASSASDRGFSWYDALQVKVNKRYAHRLTGTAAFTWQKELEYGVGVTNNVYNSPVNKMISSFSQPLVLAVGLSYQAPAWGGNRWVRSVVRDWTIGSVLKYSSGFPILVPSGQNNLQNLLFGNSSATQAGTTSGTLASGTFANRVPGQPLFLRDLNCHCIDPNKDFVFNPAAWADPAPGQFGTAAAYYNDYRFQRHPSEQLGIGRMFTIREAISLEVRLEFFNAFNRAQMADPTYSNALATQQRNAKGVPTSGFGYINSQSPGNASVIDNQTGLGGIPREGQLLVRFKF